MVIEREAVVPAAADRPAAGKRPPRILQLIHSDEAGGVEALAAIIAGGLAKRGVRVETHFLYPAFTAGKATKIRGMATTALRILRERPDVLIAYQSTASVMAGVVGRLAGIRTRIVHQTAMPDTVHPLVNRLDRSVGGSGAYTVNIVNSAATDAAFADYPPSYRRYVRRIEHGLAPLLPRGSRATTLARFAVPDDMPILLAAGRLSDQKAQDRIIRALALLPPCRLVLAGGGPNEDAYRALARQLGVEARVHFLGFLARDDIGDLLGAADVFVFPSVWETFGLAPVEAAMAGVPVVAADLPVLREVMSAGGETVARFADATDAKAFAAEIAAVLADPGAKERARAFAPRIADKYALDRMVDAYVELVLGQ